MERAIALSPQPVELSSSTESNPAPDTDLDTTDPGRDLGLIQQGIENLLNRLQTLVQSQLLATPLPLVGNNLQNAVELFAEASELLAAEFASLSDSATPEELQVALFNVFGPEGLDWLQNLAGDDAAAVTQDDIQIAETSAAVTVNMRLGREMVLASTPLATDLGLPGLSLNVEGEAQADLGFGLDLSIGVDEAGFFMDTAAADEFSVELGLSTPGLEVGSGALGLLNFTIRDEAGDDDDDDAPTALAGTFAIDLHDQDGDDRLTLAELGTISPLDLATVALGGEGQINLNLSANVANTMLPAIEADLQIGWDLTTSAAQFGAADDETPLLLGQTPTVQFDNVQLDLGSFFDRFLGQIFSDIQSVTDTFPLKQITDVLQTRVPVLDDFGRRVLDTTGSFTAGPDGEVTLLDIIKWLNSEASLDYISTLSAFTELVNSVPNGEDVSIPLGSLSLDNLGLDARFFEAGTNELAAIEIPEDFDFSSVIDEIQDLLQNGVSDRTRNFFNSDDPTVPDVSDAQGLSFPLLENPASAFNLLLNRDVDLFRFDTPFLGTKQYFRHQIPIIGPLGAYVEGNFEIGVDFAVGYDTSGLLQGGDPNDLAQNLLNGFYITTDGEPIAAISTGLGAGAALDLVVLTAGVGGGIYSDIGLFLNDPNGDNKVHLNEFSSACFFDPLTGSLSAGLNAFIEFGFGPFTYRKNKVLASVTLLSFELGCTGSDPDDPDIEFNLAERSGDGLLLLNMGDRAQLRNDQIGNDRPAGWPVDEWFTVRRPDAAEGQEVSDLVEVSAFGFTETHENITQIEANGGEGQDTIAIAPEITLSALLHGGEGNDIITSGGGDDELYGDEGRDTLAGGDGDDELYGGTGSDDLEGGAGADIIDGGEDEDNSDIDRVSYATSTVGVIFTPDEDNPGEFTGQGGDAEGDRLINIEYIEGGQDDDSLSGDGESNTLEGLAGDDTLSGGGGDDYLIGGQGVDILDGGDGYDIISYIPSDAPVAVNLATAIAYGGDANGDTISNAEGAQGSAYNDMVFGNDDKNTLYGFAGNDLLVGGDGADDLYGDDMAGAIAGDDFLIGGAGGDQLHGGGGEDWVGYLTSPGGVTVNLADGIGQKSDAQGDQITGIEHVMGSTKGDILVGDDRANILVGLDGDDQLDGGLGDDTLFGDAGEDEINGGDGNDTADYRNSPQGVRVDLLGVGAGGHAQGDAFVEILPGFSTVENLIGTDQRDVLKGDFGANVINPRLSQGGADAVDGRGGSDRLIVDYSQHGHAANGTPTPGLFGGFIQAFQEVETNFISALDRVDFQNIEHLTVIGNGGDDELYGGAGDDILVMGGGDDQIYGGTGSNRIAAGAGDDLVVDQNASDRSFNLTPTGAVIDLDGGSGTDALRINLSHKTFDVVLALPENPVGQSYSAPDATISLRNFEIFSEVVTGEGDDQLGQAGRIDNIFRTGSGNDVLRPGLGIDQVDGGAIASTSTSGAPDDDLLILDYSEGDIGGGMEASFTSYTSGSFSRKAADGGTVLDRVEFSSIERFQITGTRQTDAVSGGSGNDTINGIEGDDIINGSFGDDHLMGGAGNDFIFDAAFVRDSSGIPAPLGNDKLQGEAGNDVLIGGSGDDDLAGGDGDDTLFGIEFGENSDLGIAEIDTMTGGTGADGFILGDENAAYYNDGNSAPADASFAQITDFNPQEGDRVFLHGAASDYTTAQDGDAIALFYRRPIGSNLAALELVAKFEGIDSLDLNADAFQYSDSGTAIINDFTAVPKDPGEAAALLLPAVQKAREAAPGATDRLTTRDRPSAAIAPPSANPQLTAPTDRASSTAPVSQPEVAVAAQATNAEFQITQNSFAPDLLDLLLGDTTGLSNITAQVDGNAEAFGEFHYSPFGPNSGIVLSTGRATKLVGENREAGGRNVEVQRSLSFTRLSGDGDGGLTIGSGLTTNRSTAALQSTNDDFAVEEPTDNDDPTDDFGIEDPDDESQSAGVFRADLSNLEVPLRSLTLADSGAGGGANGNHTGADIDQIILSTERVDSIDELTAIEALDVFDFSPGGTRFIPGSQRASTNEAFPVTPDLLGTVNGMVNNTVATLGDFDYSRTNGVSQGALSLGNGGQLTLDLAQAVDPADSLYLYVVEAVTQNESFSGEVTVSNQSQDTSTELNTDFGTPGEMGDSTTLAIAFDADDTTEQIFLQFAVGSEEFMESGGQLQNDLFNITLNGLNLAQLSDGKTASFHNLVSTPYGDVHHPDFIHNPVKTGPASDQTPLDGYTRVLTFVGDLLPNARNTLSINIQDVNDGLGDSAILLGAGTLGTANQPRGGVSILPTEGRGPIELAEGSPGRSVDVVLNSVPDEDVIVTLTPNADLDLGVGSGSPIILTFTRETALIPQSIVVTAFDDTIREGLHEGAIAVQTESAHPSYDGLAISAPTITILDNDIVPQILREPQLTAADLPSGSKTPLSSLATFRPPLLTAPDTLLQGGLSMDNEQSREPSPKQLFNPQLPLFDQLSETTAPTESPVNQSFSLGTITSSTALIHIFGDTLQPSVDLSNPVDSSVFSRAS